MKNGKWLWHQYNLKNVYQSLSDLCFNFPSKSAWTFRITQYLLNPKKACVSRKVYINLRMVSKLKPIHLILCCIAIKTCLYSKYEVINTNNYWGCISMQRQRYIIISVKKKIYYAFELIHLVVIPEIFPPKAVLSRFKFHKQ